MCGICGLVAVDGGAVDAPGIVRSMAGAIAHRGPDGEGFADLPQGTLGHRRLAIIDVAGGAQPMADPAGRHTIVFNGEIYNFRELREELRGHGFHFRTRSDTEVLLHGYAQWGTDLLPRLRGMFAFALWDQSARRLFIARDRLGIKPFYYWLDPDTRALTFASEIKALFANPWVPRGPNHGRLAEYLLYRYVAGAETMFDGVRELEPGTYGVLEADGLRLERYWQPEAPGPGRNGRDVVEHGRALLEDAVTSHLVSDVGVGTITSGGLDSSLVSALAARATGANLDTFCLGFEDPRLDERPYARQVAAGLATRHHDTVLDAAAFSEQLAGLTWMHDEPLSHPNAVAMHQVFRFAREAHGIPVLLSGEGADEVFGGYSWYRAAWKRRLLEGALGERLAGAVIRRALAGSGADVAHPDYFLFANALGRSPELRRLPAVAAVIERRREAYGQLAGSLDGLFRYDQLTYLQPLLQRQDRMSMAVGLEARVPFLDHPLVEWGNGLPATVKLGAGHPKRLLRRIAEGALPHEIIYREKVGFALPLDAWLRGPLAGELAAIAAPSGLCATLLPARDLAALLRRHASGEAALAPLLWTLLALELWDQVYFRSAAAGTVGSQRPTLTIAS